MKCCGKHVRTTRECPFSHFPHPKNNAHVGPQWESVGELWGCVGGANPHLHHVSPKLGVLMLSPSLLRVVHSMGCLTGALHFMPVKYAVWCRRGGFMGSSHMSALLKESREADGRLMPSLSETDTCITTTCVMSGNMQSYSACVKTALAYLFALFYPFLFRRPARLLPKAYWPSYLSKWPPSSVHWNWSLPKILVLHRGTSEILSHKPCFHLTSPSPARKTAAMNHCMRYIISLVQQSLSYCLTEDMWLWLKALVALWLILKENSSIYVTLLKRHFVVKVISSWAHLWSVQECFSSFY